jgi:hypothetical protein
MRVVTSSPRALVVAACALGALGALTPTPARAQVAVAVTIAEEDASQRDIASKVVSVARKKWQMLHPQLTSSQTKTCPAGNTECLRGVAAQAKATHLLVVGVAPLGVRDRVVAVQLFDVNKPTPRFEESVVQSGLNEDFVDVKRLAANLVAVPGPPAYVEPPPLEPVVPEPASGEMGALGVGGFVLVGAGALTAGASALTGWGLVEAKNPYVASQVLAVGIATGGVVAAVGTLAFVVDAF